MSKSQVLFLRDRWIKSFGCMDDDQFKSIVRVMNRLLSSYSVKSDRDLYSLMFYIYINVDRLSTDLESECWQVIVTNQKVNSLLA